MLDVPCRVLLLQLPVPPPGIQPMEGNIPLAPALLKSYARHQGLDRDFSIDILSPQLTDSLGDEGLLHAVLRERPALVGFTCYVWNIERSLWLADQIKRHRPEVQIILGGPEVTEDNRWVLDHAAVDYAVFGEGEATFAEFLASIRANRGDSRDPIPGLWRKSTGKMPELRRNEIALEQLPSPYLEGILDASASRTLFLETVRGCRFQCKYCYYAKRSTSLRSITEEQIEAHLRHAISSGVEEVYLLDPTINQRPDFDDFLRLLARCNPYSLLQFSGELRAEGIDREKARLLKAANFAELEIGLQSVEPVAHRLMGRPVNLESWERGVRALMDEGIRVRLDLILGLPGDDVSSIRRGIDFLARFRPEAEMQIFNLSLLPGTEFRRDAERLGLKYQAKPPYYVFQTPTLGVEQMYSLMEEAQEVLGIEFDAPSLPIEDESAEAISFDSHRPATKVVLDLDDPLGGHVSTTELGLITTLQLRSTNFSRVETNAEQVVAEVVRSNPHITLRIVLEPIESPERLRPSFLDRLAEICYASTSYLDRFYSLHPGTLIAAKRLFLLLPMNERTSLSIVRIRELGACATILWYGLDAPDSPLDDFEYWLERAEIS